MGADSNAVPEGAPGDALVTGTSPYASGGGGVTFERKVAVQYLAHLIVGDAAQELGADRRVVSVAFQQAPDHPVDDLVITAARTDESEPSLVLALGVRRAPKLVKSDEPSQRLIGDFVQAVVDATADGFHRRFALVVAGPQDPAQQLGQLAGLASAQMNAAAFFDLVRAPGKFTADVRGRLDQIEALVTQALRDLRGTDPDATLARQTVWALLSRLTVLMPRLEAPDETDWASVMNSLVSVSRGGDLAGASRLRDRLVAVANEYPPKAATVDLIVLRRDVHAALDSTIRRHQKGWQALHHLDERALSVVHDEIASSDGARRLHLRRDDAARQVVDNANIGTAVLLHGESGVGKSALGLKGTLASTGRPQEAAQTTRINLRHLPRTTLEFESILGCSLQTLLAELSAPQRTLIVDAADAVAEGMGDQFRYLVDAAHSANVALVAITAADTKQVVLDTIAERFRGAIVEQIVLGLTDAQLDEVVATFPNLTDLARNARARELLRRPVVIDLFVRGDVSGIPISDADAMQQVWSGLVRRHERSDRGTPDARDIAMTRLAGLALSGGDPLDVVGAIDPVALEGLRRDGLLRRALEDPFRIGPEFAHDEVRRYAVARLLLASPTLTTKLLDADVPRWALGAARLACQARFIVADSPANPLRGRLARLQDEFDALVTAGYGERWGDVPGEALLTLGDPEPVLRDAWSELLADGEKGLQQIGRLIDQRLRDPDHLVRIAAVEPVVKLLLEVEQPRWMDDHAESILRDWLRAHVMAETPAGHPLRVRLRNRINAACDAADRRREEARAAAAAVRAARTPDEIERERVFLEQHSDLFTEIGYPRSRRRQRPEVPSEVKNKNVVEFLALLGPDLGEEGEAILRRVARDAPSWLAPALEEAFTGRALARYRRGFLAELTQAYYLDDEEDGSGLREEGIRNHQSRSLGVVPLSAWYKGPFTSLFQTDFTNGVAVLNRMLNHAALARARTLASLSRHDGASVDDRDLNDYRTELNLTGVKRVYVGDAHVWLWYRGSGVGPYPCMSALQALERVCDQLIELGMPIGSIVATLLDGCENLAMVGLVVGLLVRHLDRADRLLDPYLSDPWVWHFEIDRLVSESGGLAARSNGIVAAERRQWSMRETAMYLVLRADDVRVRELRAVGEQLVDNAREQIVADLERAGETQAIARDKIVDDYLAMVRAWASALDSGTYNVHQTAAGLHIQSNPPDDVLQSLQRSNEDVLRAQEAMRLMVRYHFEPRRGPQPDISPDDLAKDLSSARDLLQDPPRPTLGNRWDTPTAVAAAALSAHLLREVPLADDLLVFAVDTVLRVGAGEAWPREFETDDSYYEQGADRSAARALPLLLLPSARPLLRLIDGGDESPTYGRVVAAGSNLARAIANEVRLHLARGLDSVWRAQCAENANCHHRIALEWALESMRDCAFGDWDPDGSRRPSLRLEDPLEVALEKLSPKAVHFARLDAGIRALAPATAGNICVSARARVALSSALATQRKSLLAYDRNVDARGSRALVSARALLTLAVNADDGPLFEHLEVVSKSADLLDQFLCGLSAAAEESEERATTAARLWPAVAERGLDLLEAQQAPRNDDYFGQGAIAALLPNAAEEVAYLYPELAGKPIVWWKPLAWRDVIGRWLPLAAGKPRCVDHLIGCLTSCPRADQVRSGLAWVAKLVLADPAAIADGSVQVAPWLIDMRATAAEERLLDEWQRVVDALVVAGVSKLAPYSE